MLALAAVDVGEGGGVDHGIRPRFVQDALDVGGVGHVEAPERQVAEVAVGALVPRRPERLVSPLGEQPLQQLRPEQPVAPGHHDAHRSPPRGGRLYAAPRAYFRPDSR